MPPYNYYINDFVSNDFPNKEGLTLRVIAPDDRNYSAQLRQAFEFFRRHDDRRYSSRTKMRMLNAADEVDDLMARGGVTQVDNFPQLLVLDSPYEYDEDTETKRGGMLGCSVIWPLEDGLFVTAVHRSSRRLGLGKCLIQQMIGVWHPVSTRVNARNNIVGQQFLLSQGMFPVSINSAGVLTYSMTSADDESGEDEMLVMPGTLSARQRHDRNRVQRAVVPPPWPEEAYVPNEAALRVREAAARLRRLRPTDYAHDPEGSYDSDGERF